MVCRQRHPFEGKALVVIDRIRKRDGAYLLLRLPEGSSLQAPAVWTTAPESWSGTALSAIYTKNGALPIAQLLRLRFLVDAALRQTATPRKCPEAPQQLPKRNEEGHAESTLAVQRQAARDKAGCGLGATRRPSSRTSSAAARGTDGSPRSRRGTSGAGKRVKGGRR